jgi:F-type H+-transporting ATPase subunit delta
MALRRAVARRYAEAAFELGRQNNTVDQWRTDLSFLAEIFNHRKLLYILSEPTLGFPIKKDIITKLATDKVQPQALGLALVMIERNLPDYMPLVHNQFERLYDEYKNVAHAVVITAVPLDDGEKNRLIGYLKELTSKEILLTTEVDPSILGGVIARVGDTLIDGSIRHRLEILREQISRGTFVVAQ